MSNETIYIESKYGSVFTAELVKRTPSGQTVVKIPSNEHEIRFDKNGNEMGKYISAYRYDRIITKEKYEAIKASKAKDNACIELYKNVDKLRDCFYNNGKGMNKESLISQLESVLESVKAY